MKTTYPMICAILVILATASVGLADLNAGLVAYYPFNGNANDEGSNGNNGTVVGATLTQDRFGNANSAYYFDGVGDYIVAAADNLPAGERTVSLWFKIDSVANRPILLGYGGGGAPGTSWLEGVNIGGASSFSVQSHWGYNYLAYYYSEEPVEGWYNYIVTTSTAGTQIYVNGQLRASNTNFINNTIVPDTDFAMGAEVDTVGVAPYTDSAAGYLKGVLDDVRIYNRVLSLSEIQELQDMAVVFPSGVTGLNVGGKLYNVTFNDGYFTDFWPDGSPFPPFWGDRTQSEATAIALAEALSTVPPTTHLTTASGSGGTWQFLAIPFDGFYWPDPETLVPIYWIVEYQPVPSGDWQVVIDMPGDSYYLWAVFTNTPVGEDVEVSAPEAGTTITFAHVDVTGDTTVTTTQGGPPPPTGFRLMPLKTYYAIDTTAEFSGTIEIAIEYDDAGLSAGQEAALKLRHYDEASTTWEDITTSLDTVNNIIYGATDHLSFFAITMGRLVEIDIKPGSYPNTINLASQGVIPVAILSSPDFDATTVNPETVELSGVGVAVRGKGNKYLAHEEDVNGDGLLDLVCKVETENFDPEAFQYGFADLTGETYDGVRIKGDDEVIIVPPEE